MVLINQFHIATAIIKEWYVHHCHFKVVLLNFLLCYSTGFPYRLKLYSHPKCMSESPSSLDSYFRRGMQALRQKKAGLLARTTAEPDAVCTVNNSNTYSSIKMIVDK